MEHEKQKEVEILMTNNIPVLLVGEAGTGKSTLLMNVAKKANRPYSFIAGSRQTTVSSILGFMSVTGVYVPSVFRKAYEEGHYFNIDECDAMDPNVLLVFNSLENDRIAFPDGYDKAPHPEFRLCATANPVNEHHNYTGRSKLDMSSLDRFDNIEIPRSKELEIALTDLVTHTQIEIMRKILDNNNTDRTLSMRDAIRWKKRKDLELDEDYTVKLLKEAHLVDQYNKAVTIPEKEAKARSMKQSEAQTIDELWDVIQKEAESNKVDDIPKPKTNYERAKKYAQDYMASNGRIILPKGVSVLTKPKGSDSFGINVYVKINNQEFTFKREEL